MRGGATVSLNGGNDGPAPALLTTPQPFDDLVINAVYRGG